MKLFESILYEDSILNGFESLDTKRKNDIREASLQILKYNLDLLVKNYMSGYKSRIFSKSKFEQFKPSKIIRDEFSTTYEICKYRIFPNPEFWINKYSKELMFIKKTDISLNIDIKYVKYNNDIMSKKNAKFLEFSLEGSNFKFFTDFMNNHNYLFSKIIRYLKYDISYYDQESNIIRFEGKDRRKNFYSAFKISKQINYFKIKSSYTIYLSYVDLLSRFSLLSVLYDSYYSSADDRLLKHYCSLVNNKIFK